MGSEVASGTGCTDVKPFLFCFVLFWIKLLATVWSASSCLERLSHYGKSAWESDHAWSRGSGLALTIRVASTRGLRVASLA